MNIPGFVLHSTASTRLDEILKKPAHAILLSGPAGSGKTHIAQAVAMMLLQVTGLENHAYYRNITPKNNSVTIEQIRELTEFFRLKVPGKSTIARVAVLEDADTMGTEAQNALLKLLEEPPIGSVIILTSSQPQRLLSTIRSRVQLIHLPSPEASTLQKHFVTEGHTETAVAAAILRTNGNVAGIQALLNESTDESDDVVTLVKQVLGGTPYDRLLLVETLVKRKDKGVQFVITLAAVAAASLDAAATKNAPSLARWHSVLEVAHIAEESYARNGNAKLILTELMLAL